MAIKDQCNNCKLFDGNICRAHNTFAELQPNLL